MVSSKGGRVIQKSVRGASHGEEVVKSSSSVQYQILSKVVLSSFRNLASIPSFLVLIILSLTQISVLSSYPKGAKEQVIHSQCFGLEENQLLWGVHFGSSLHVFKIYHVGTIIHASFCPLTQQLSELGILIKVIY